MKRRLLALLLMAWLLPAKAGSFEQDFAVVMIGANDEARYGKWPLSRSVLARAINQVADYGGDGVIVKFFLDQPRDEAGDRALAAAMARIPVLLQACMDETETRPNALAPRFVLAGGNGVSAVKGTSGWLPLPRFSQVAAGLGFVDFSTPLVPLTENYQGQQVRSLVLAAMEMAQRTQAKFSAEGLQIGGLHYQPGRQNQLLARLDPLPEFRSFSLTSLEPRSVATIAWRHKIVILAYDGPASPTIATQAGPVKVHRRFIQILKALYDGRVSPMP